MPSKHFIYGGSTAQRTLSCPAWQIKRKQLPSALTQNTGNIFADRGTLLHDAMEELIDDVDSTTQLESFIGRRLNDAEIVQEDIDEALEPAIDAFWDYANFRGISAQNIKTEIECEIDEDIGGTCDVLAWNNDTVFVIDHKFGHFPVSPVESAQGLFYAMCAKEDVKERYKDVFTPERQNLVIAILQPSNAERGDHVMNVWKTDMDHLAEFSDTFFESIDSATEEDLVSGSHCKYCPVATVCPQKTGLARKSKMLDLTDMKQLSEAMGMVSELDSWCKAVKALAHSQAELGNKVDGYKLVAKRASRKWNDEDAVMDIVRKARKIKLEEAVDMKLLSPPKFEKVCKKLGVDITRYAEYISAVSSGSSLVTVNDKRPELLSVEAIGSAIANNS